LLVPPLDWLARFRVEELPASERGTVSVVVVDRNGRRETGFRAAALLARALPGLFLLWPLLALAAGRRPAGRARLTDT
jgi:hypothetical protein